MTVEKVTIHSLGSSCEGVGSLEGYTLFVPGALPGETVEAEIVERHKRYAKGELVSIIKPSPFRVEPPCPLFGSCGGCQIMHLDYEQQLEVKRQRVTDALVRIGKIENPPVMPCSPSPDPLWYRNKIQLPVQEVGGKLLIGLYKRNSHDLVEVKKCYIHNQLGEKVYQAIRDILHKPQFYLEGCRSIWIRSSEALGEALVVFVTTRKPSEKLKEIVRVLMETCPAIKGVFHNENTTIGNVLLNGPFTLLQGKEFINEKISGLMFRVSPNAFFQVNPKQAEKLYQTAIDLAELKGDEIVMDAFCGVGSLSLIFAKKAKKVIGIECVRQAIKDAEENARNNKITNCTFYEGFAEKLFSKLEEPDLLLLNPPRKGCASSLIDSVGKVMPKTILYISCDPATLARDLSQITSFGYDIKTVQPFDMFPQTSHVETLVKLTRKY